MAGSIRQVMGQNEITEILESGQPNAVERVVPLLFEELRAIAASKLRLERADHTLQPTALVNELYLKLAAADGLSARNRGHLLAVAAGCIRQILVDHARKSRAHKRGANWRRVTLHVPCEAPNAEACDLLSLHEAIEKLGAVNARHARIVEMRLFGGMTGEQIAAHLGLSRTIVTKEWRFAQAWLSRELRD